MESLDLLFRPRIGFHEGRMTFDDLPALLTATSLALPFENLAVIERRELPITRRSLIAKLLLNQEGGLCYELNPLLYFFLLDNGFDVSMVHGDFVFELKQRYKDDDWRIGIVFDSRQPITTTECEEIRQIIAQHPASIFNRQPLLTKLTERGSVTLTDTSLTIMEDGSVLKQPVSPESFGELLALHFGLFDN